MKATLRAVLMLLAAAGWLAGVSAAADAPRLEKIDLFERNTGGYALYRIPGIVVTAKGTLLAYCEARLTSGSDWDTIDIMLRRSTDGGRTWEPARKIADVPGPKAKNPVTQGSKSIKPDSVTYNNPLAIADRDGTVHFLFCLEYARAFLMQSDDDGLTFSEPVEITAAFEGFRPQYDWKVLATGPGHGIQLSGGRLLVPVWISPGTGGGFHRPSVASAIYSDDHGRSWHSGEIAVPDTPDFIFPSETAAVQLADGRVMLNSRTESKSHRRVITYSRDGATGWTAPVFHEQLVEPICMAGMVRLSQAPQSDRNRILFSNPHNLERADGQAAPGKSRDRKNLSIKLSYDEGQTWPVDKVIEPGYSAYSDLAVGPDGTIYCFYERGSGTETGTKPTSYAYLTLARFNLQWLSGGNDSLSR